MVLGEIITRMRLILGRDSELKTFDLIGGAMDFEVASRSQTQQKMAFVLPLNDNAGKNKEDSGIVQTITEKFAVLVAISNQKSQSDKTGMLAYDEVHNLRKYIFKAILGYQITTDVNALDEDNTSSLVYYAGGSIVQFDRESLWYRYDFEYRKDINNYYNEDKPGCNDGVDLDRSTLDNFPDSQTHLDITKDG